MLSAITNAEGGFSESDMLRRRRSPSMYCAQLGGVRRGGSFDPESARTVGTRNGTLLFVLKLKSKITLYKPVIYSYTDVE